MKRFILLLLLAACAAPVPAADLNLGADIASRGLLLTLASVFMGGVLVSLTPCLYPMIPITLSVIGANSEGRKPLNGFFRALAFVLGIAAVYTLIGVAASMLGVGIQRVLQYKVFWLFLSLFFGAMGLSMLGMFELQLPASLTSRLRGRAGGKGGFAGAFAVGLVTGVAASPCGSPVLASLAVFGAEQANQGRMGLSALLFFVYALGIGALYLLLGTFPAFLNSVPKAGGWMEDVKKFLGAVLIGVAFYYLQFAFSAGWMLLYWALVLAVLIAAALVAAVRARSRHRDPVLFHAWQMSAFALLGAALWVGVAKVPTGFDGARAQAAAQGAAAAPAADTDQTAAPASQTTNGAAAPHAGWISSEEEGLALAMASGKPLLIDFGADWCSACKQLERETFTDPQVMEELKHFVAVRIDATDLTEEVEALQEKYGAQTLPTVAFVSPTGKKIPGFDLKTFEKPEAFLQRLRNARQAGAHPVR